MKHNIFTLFPCSHAETQVLALGGYGATMPDKKVGPKYRPTKSAVLVLSLLVVSYIFKKVCPGNL